MERAAEWIHYSLLLPWDRNPRKNGPAIEKVAASIDKYGFAAPIVAWAEKQRIVAGHSRLAAVSALIKKHGEGYAVRGAPSPGMIPVRYHPFKNEQEANEYAIADNRLGEIAEWDEPGLASLLQEADRNGSSLSVIGWEAPDYKELLGHLQPANFGESHMPAALPAAASAGDDRAQTVVIVFADDTERRALCRVLGVPPDHNFKSKKMYSVKELGWKP